MVVKEKTSVPENIAAALAQGRGIERPFQCHEHPDRHASASINSITGLWYCHGCGAKGKADTSEPPEADVILEMLALGQVPRTYPLTWLDLFDVVAPEYWLQRFPDPQVVKTFRLGVHPTTGCPTFPVFEGSGLSRLAGVGVRRENGKPRYIYPQGFNASHSFGAPVSPWAPHEVVVLVEGIADAVALAMSGITAWACWGAGVHEPQANILLDMEVGHVLLGFDNDHAGRSATKQAMDMSRIGLLSHPVQWPDGIKDPGEMKSGDETFDYLLNQVKRRSWDLAGLLEEQRRWWMGEDCKVK